MSGALRGRRPSRAGRSWKFSVEAPPLRRAGQSPPWPPLFRNGRAWPPLLRNGRPWLRPDRRVRTGLAMWLLQLQRSPGPGAQRGLPAAAPSSLRVHADGRGRNREMN
ncbi:uncharacterized protein PS065_002044 isoform 2-T2 [Dugong dugon]